MVIAFILVVNYQKMVEVVWNLVLFVITYS